jgi:hypothetical protein
MTRVAAVQATGKVLAGHYALPEIFELTIDREPRSMLREASVGPPTPAAMRRGSAAEVGDATQKARRRR